MQKGVLDFVDSRVRNADLHFDGDVAAVRCGSRYVPQIYSQASDAAVAYLQRQFDVRAVRMPEADIWDRDAIFKHREPNGKETIIYRERNRGRSNDYRIFVGAPGEAKLEIRSEPIAPSNERHHADLTMTFGNLRLIEPFGRQGARVEINGRSLPLETVARGRDITNDRLTSFSNRAMSWQHYASYVPSPCDYLSAYDLYAADREYDPSENISAFPALRARPQLQHVFAARGLPSFQGLAGGSASGRGAAQQTMRERGTSTH